MYRSDILMALTTNSDIKYMLFAIDGIDDGVDHVVVKRGRIVKLELNLAIFHAYH
ncbi:MAG: hypothetical protein HRU04_23535 [Oceanospirillaceae bacterium]|nr:hypothetical protein [Oceanospirillaceae bacterium]